MRCTPALALEGSIRHLNKVPFLFLSSGVANWALRSGFRNSRRRRFSSRFPANAGTRECPSRVLNLPDALSQALIMAQNLSSFP